ncbi:MAG: hypothetical protein QM570_15430 [Planctomycetota bacterium]|jgi:hypothetical protein|nr:hypothetical protein [Planctomycetota bacterium]
MKFQRIIIAFAVLLLAAMTIGQTPTCPEQEFADTQGWPFAVDVNEIAIDPASGRRLALDYRIADVGREVAYDGWACDPDGHLMLFAASKGVLEHPTPDTYTLRYTPVTAGLHYIHISVTDVPEEHQIAQTRTGTLVIRATRPNAAPVLCGGRP